MKRTVLLLVFCSLFSNTLFAKAPTYFCGGYFDQDAFFYNLFNQENISQKAFYPFLRTNEDVFYESMPKEYLQNIQEWYAYFDQRYTKENLVKIVFGKQEELSKLKSSNTKVVSAKKYLEFAKKCEQVTLSAEPYHYWGWDYKALVKKRQNKAPKLITEGRVLYQKEQQEAVKLRYAYQLVRLYRYSHRFNEALDFFNNEVSSIPTKNEIYYYILDQIAGCYYKLKDYEKAAYLFLKVFDKSIDKKQSAFTSYKFCTYKNAEGKSLFKTDEDKANQIFITAIRKFSDTMQDLNDISYLGVSEDKQELLVMRIINNLERSILRIDFEKPIFKKEKSTLEELNELDVFVDAKIKSNPSNIDFWKLVDVYISFLYQNFEQATEKLKSITTQKFKDQKERLSHVLEVFSWDKVTPEREEWLGEIFTKEGDGTSMLDICNSRNDHKRIKCNFKSIIVEQLSHLYLKEHQIVKSFLLHNNLSYINDISSHELADGLLAFAEKKNKNVFEKLMLKYSAKNGLQNSNVIETIRKAKGLMYFRSGDINKAISYFSPSEEKNIPPTVFSNNVVECFDCDPLYVMEDEVFKASAYSFLNTKMNTYDLLSNLQELERMTEDESIKEWKRKLAYYLLGNYFFNVSNTGYYRTIVYPGRSTYYNYDFGGASLKLADIINKKSTYSFPNYGYGNTYNGLANKAKYYYEETIALSTDNELNARCAYMVAKCELNEYYNNGYKGRYSGYDGSAFGEFENSGFEALKTKYRNTNFYERIESRCNFFRQYDGY